METKLIPLKSKVKHCKRCPLHVERIQPVFGHIPPPKDRNGLLVVGEAPGYMEDVSGEPFVGKSGKLLTDKLEEYGFKRSETVILNAVKCKPPENRDPTNDELFWCNDYLVEQINIIKPSVILTVGKIPTWTVVIEKDLDFENPPINKMDGLKTFFGAVYESEIGGVKYPTIVCYHPAYWLRNRNAIKEFVDPQFELLRKTVDENHGESAPDISSESS